MFIVNGVIFVCLVKMYLRYLDLLGIIEDKDFFLFRLIFRLKNVCKLIYKNKKFSYILVRSNFLFMLKLVVGEYVNIGIYFFRLGGVIVVVSLNVDERCLKRYGRWKIDLVKDGYIVDFIEKCLLVLKLLNL